MRSTRPLPPRKAPDLTVILATRNRAESLRETLYALAQQETGGAFTYEVVVVDNDSTDSTRDVVKELQATFPVLLRYYYEGRPGKPFALNTGLHYAQGRFFAFTDDDILPTPSWLWALWRCFQEEHADGIAGKILPLWVVSRPAWLTNEAATRLIGMGCVDRGPHRLRSRDRPHNCSWVGGNMAIRRQVVQRIGAYAAHVGKSEDAEYYYRCIRQGLEIVYEPTALVFHRLGAERCTLAYFRHYYHMTGHNHAYFKPPWRAVHLMTLAPLSWYLGSIVLAARWLRGLIMQRSWLEQFHCELQLRLRLSLWFHRLQLWPWWLSRVLMEQWHRPQSVQDEVLEQRA